MVDKEPDFQPSEERNDWDMERIHSLAERLLPIYADVASGKVENPKEQRYLNELIGILHDLHPADMATVLESLPQPERVLVWKLAEPDEDGEVLLEVSDAVRETLIESMGQQELLAAIEDLDADELAELAPDLPKEVITEALQSRDAEERAQVVSALSYEEDEVGALMNFAASVHGNNKKLYLYRPSKQVRGLLDELELTGFFAILENEDDILIRLTV